MPAHVCSGQNLGEMVSAPERPADGSDQRLGIPTNSSIPSAAADASHTAAVRYRKSLPPPVFPTTKQTLPAQEKGSRKSLPQ